MTVTQRITATGLQRFLARSAELRRPPTVLAASGLERFLVRARPFLRALPDAPPAKQMMPPPDPERIARVLQLLRGPLQRARAGGAFLNVWSVAGLRRKELRHAAVLAWFLGPRGSHGFGVLALSSFLDTVADHNPGWPDLGRDLSRVTVRTEEWPLGSETDRVDIAIDGPDFVLFIEVKIDAPEGPEQLPRYVEAAKDKARILKRAHSGLIYLSPRPPRNYPADVAVISWREVAKAFAALPRDGLNGAIAAQFARHIRTL